MKEKDVKEKTHVERRTRWRQYTSKVEEEGKEEAVEVMEMQQEVVTGVVVESLIGVEMEVVTAY